MAVKLRLKRMGKKKKPFYRIVAADSRAPRDGRFIEMVGTYDPIATPHKVDYKEDRIFYWLSNGAQPTQTVKNLFQGKGLWLKWTLTKQGADDAKIASEMEAWEKIQEEKAQRLADKKAKQAEKKAKEKEKEAEQAEETLETAEAVEQTDAPEAPETAEAEVQEEQGSSEKPAEA